jgi:hypothetical protein
MGWILTEILAFFQTWITDILSQFLARVVGVTALLALSGCLGGCAGKDATFAEKQQSLEAMTDTLRKSNFVGDVDLNMGGSPLGLNAATNWSLGPAQSTLHVKGGVDFTKPPRLPEATPK